MGHGTVTLDRCPPNIKPAPGFGRDDSERDDEFMEWLCEWKEGHAYSALWWAFEQETKEER